MPEPKEMFVSLPTDLVRQFIADYDFDSEPEAEGLVAILRPLLADLPPFKHAFYFGCVDQAGHYLWGASGGGRPLRLRRDGMETLLGTMPGWTRKEGNKKALIPWGWMIDGKLIPQHYGEGEAALHHKDGWTALAFWDMSVDTRPRSVSCFLFDAPDLEYHQAIRAAMETFPTIWERYTFEVVPRPV